MRMAAPLLALEKISKRFEGSSPSGSASRFFHLNAASYLTKLPPRENDFRRSR